MKLANHLSALTYFNVLTHQAGSGGVASDMHPGVQGSNPPERRLSLTTFIAVFLSLSGEWWDNTSSY
jgi:hypothetical protein